MGSHVISMLKTKKIRNDWIICFSVKEIVSGLPTKVIEINTT